ncbi:UrcA family protein [Sphingomonas sp. LY29]|uniref:UrcA family protein n=1 Tax=Sphingomonas sp. LY29 TaxID=3095341 RepID=UPI002D76F96A|nr:UrcA family protein [Sphingomonas sp. LY29]WRP24676.1 UrcA family protein [Sphingomonas sp. LY29]
MLARFSCSGAIAASLILSSAAAVAQRPVVVQAKPSEVPTAKVSYTDLNLASTEGAATLEKRVGKAIRKVCAANNTYSASPERHFTTCAANARAQARPQIASAVARAQQMAATGSATLAAASTITIVRN